MTRIQASFAVAGALFLCAACDRTQEDHAADAASQAIHGSSEALRNAGDVARKGAREARGALEDSAVTAKVKTALMVQKNVKGADINIDTKGGVVTLTGRLQDQSQIDQALQVARNVEGVKAVENKLSVAGPSQPG